MLPGAGASSLNFASLVGGGGGGGESAFHTKRHSSPLLPIGVVRPDGSPVESPDSSLTALTDHEKARSPVTKS